MKTEITAPPWWARLMSRVQSLGKPVVAHSVRHNTEGLTVVTSYTNGEVVRSEMTWAEVDEAIAFKRDCYTVDLSALCSATKKAAWK